MSRSRPEYIAPGSPKFEEMVIDCVARYRFEIDRSASFLDELGYYCSIWCDMQQIKDPSDTRRVYLERVGEDKMTWQVVQVIVPYYAEHKAAVYGEACVIALDLHHRIMARGTVSSRVVTDHLLVIETLDRCPSCGSYLQQQQKLSRSGSLLWLEACPWCAYDRLM